MAKFSDCLKKKKKKKSFLFSDNKFQSLAISNKQAGRALDTGRRTEKIKEAISYLTNFISYFPMKGENTLAFARYGVSNIMLARENM